MKNTKTRRKVGLLTKKQSRGGEISASNNISDSILFTLDPDKSIYADTESMIYKKDGIYLITHVAGFTQYLSGGDITVNEYKNETEEPQTFCVGTKIQGTKILEIPIKGEETLITKPGVYVAYTFNIKQSISSIKSSTIFLSGNLIYSSFSVEKNSNKEKVKLSEEKEKVESINEKLSEEKEKVKSINEKLSEEKSINENLIEEKSINEKLSEGKVWIMFCGDYKEHTLEEGEILIADEDNVVAFEEKVNQSITSVGGLLTITTGNKFVVKFTGPGKVYTQSCSLRDMAYTLQKYLPKPQVEVVNSDGLISSITDGASFVQSQCVVS
jgi:uncharacterized protein (AIM24 family)